MNLKKAIHTAKKGSPTAQKYLYEQYKISLFAICLRYAGDPSEAEDILQEGFLNIFKDLHQFMEKGNLEGCR